MAVLLCAVLLLAGCALLLSQWVRQRRRQRLVEQRLQGRAREPDALGGWLQRLGNSRLGQRSLNLDSETRQLLDRVGWRRSRQRSLFAAVQVGLPFCLMGAGVVVQEVFFRETRSPWLFPLMGLGLGYLVPKRVLAWLAVRRQRQVAQEVATFIPLLRILFESGMAVEQSLRVLSNEGKLLMPTLTHELRLVLARVDSGLELGDELHKVTRLLAVDEFTDTCVILQQLLHQGGGAMKSLLSLKQLLDDRRLTRLQEYISKMSAKMSVVMMLFLFPALLIVLAGPAFTAIARAFAS